MSGDIGGRIRTGGGGDPAAGSRSGGAKPPEGVAKLGDGREFELIRGFYPGGIERRPDVVVGAGDDAAVVRGEGIVVTTDLSIEGVHFRRDWLTPQEIGYRATTAALSDLAAMAARPVGVLVSLALPSDDVPQTAREIMSGVREAASQVGATLLGGDVSASPTGLVIDVVALGEAADPVLRSGAQVGDEVWVTGRLGGAARAVEQLLGGEAPSTESLERFKRPVARTEESRWLAERGLPTAMLDLSDGLAGDAAHLARASGVAVVLDEASIPVHDPQDDRSSAATRLRLALGGGEDYELLFAARPGAVVPHVSSFVAEFGCFLTRVGRVVEGEGVHILGASGETKPVGTGGYQHFRPYP